jgi:glycyl-tRNA synthetase
VGADGALLPRFITVANGAALDDAAVRYGNEAVLRARFADATYFWKQDTARSLASFGERLAGLSFHEKLGSMADKVTRLRALVPAVAAELGLDAAESAAAARATELAKNDLGTAMVVDFTSLQGVMGREYALRSGEGPEVAEAIREQYLPRGGGDALPQTGPGRALALADRLDSLVGLFAAGLRPKGANDPFALRRAAQGICAILVDAGAGLDLARAVDLAAAPLPLPLSAEARAEVLDFLRRRLEVQLREAGHAPDAVAAVLAVLGSRPAAARAALEAMAPRVASPSWPETLTAYARCARIVRGQGGGAGAGASGALVEPAEVALAQAIDAESAGLDRDDLGAVLDALERLAPAIKGFFDSVLVMADDPALRAARLGLVGRVAALPDGVADLGKLEGF